MTTKEIQKLRKISFSKKIDLNNKLIELVSKHTDHDFLSNPTSQNNYLYLIEYLKEFSKKWFNKPFEELKILDWGCGKGHISFLLKEMGANVTSCDINDLSDDSAFGQKTPIINKTEIYVIPLNHEYILPFEDNFFDIVLSFGVLEHVPNDFESIKEIQRILKPKGLLYCFFLPFKYSWTQKLAHLRGNFYHDRFYDNAIITDLAKHSKLNVIDYWHRALLPKNSISYFNYRLFENLDQFICNYTFLKYFATNVEFVAYK